MYINWIAGAGNPHDVFFTDPRIIASYRKCITIYYYALIFMENILPEKYVRTIVNRYKNSPNIFAWELINEARCLGDILPAGPNCVAGTNVVPKWYRQQSDFVRSL